MYYAEDYMLLSHKTYDYLVVVFSSLDKHRVENGKYDLYSLTKNHEFSTLLVRDVDNTWYNNQMKSKTSVNLLEDLRSVISNYKSVLFFGFSMGGFGAIYFGARLRVKNIISLCPQAFIALEKMRAIGDTRFLGSITDIRDIVVDDLGKISRHQDTSIVVYYSGIESLDGVHAIYLQKNIGADVVRLSNISHSALSVFNYFGITHKIILSCFGIVKKYDLLEDINSKISDRSFVLAISNIKASQYKSEFTLGVCLINKSSKAWDDCLTKKISISVLIKEARNGKIRQDYAIPLYYDCILTNETYENKITIDYSDLPVGQYEIYINLKEGEKVSFEDIGFPPTRLYFEVNKKVSFGNVFFNGEYTGTPQVICDGSQTIDFNFIKPDEYIHEVRSGRLNSDTGQIRNGAVIFSGKIPGLVIFGPYIDLPSGYYTAYLEFLDMPKSGSGLLDVISAENAKHAEKRIEFSRVHSNKISIGWAIDSPQTGVEIRLHIDESTEGVVSGMRIVRE